MKLSKKTLAVLKNFAAINQSIVVKPGSIIETISNVKDIFAKITVEETFEKGFAIYDLNEFLGVVSLFEDPDFEFNDGQVIISQGKMKQKYYYADPAVITSPPEKGVTLPSVEVKASMQKEQWGVAIRAASANNASTLTFTNGDIIIHDKGVPNSNNFAFEKVASHDVDYNLSISVEKLKMIMDDYDIEVCSKGLARFSGAQGIDYFIALLPDGKYGS
jgi:hypothetical protein